MPHPKRFSLIKVGLCIFLILDYFKNKENDLKIYLYGLVHSKAGTHIDILKSGIKQTNVSEAIVQVEKKCLHYHIIKAKVICLIILTLCKVHRQ